MMGYCPSCSRIVFISGGIYLDHESDPVGRPGVYCLMSGHGCAHDLHL